MNSNKQIKFFIIVISLTMLASNITTKGLITEDHTTKTNENLNVKNNIKAQSHNPIIIIGNNELITQATDEEWKGNGSQNSPYIISNYLFQGPSDLGISISDTNLFIVITNCEFNEIDNPIHLSNVTNINISFNLISKPVIGIETIISHNMTIQENILSSDPEPRTSSGISLIGTNDTIIQDNELMDITNSIMIQYGSNNNKISHNNITRTQDSGTGIMSVSNNQKNVFDGNLLQDSNIYLRESSNGLFTQNIIFITSSYADGFYIQESNNNTFQNNIVKDSTGQAVYISPADTGCSNNTFLYNDFINNSFTIGGRQAVDENKANNFTENYWSDWTQPDTNNDGIVDNPYPIETGYNDPRPHTTNINNFFAPTIKITNPSSENQILKRKITITWEAFDFEEAQLNYSILLWNGTKWTALATNLDQEEFQWDTITVQDGEFYKIQVLVSDGLFLASDTSENVTIKNWPKNDPSLTFTNQILLTNSTVSGQVNISWEANDPDGDLMTFNIYQIDINGTHLLSEKQSEMYYLWNTTLLPKGIYQIKVAIVTYFNDSQGWEIASFISSHLNVINEKQTIKTTTGVTPILLFSSMSVITARRKRSRNK